MPCRVPEVWEQIVSWRNLARAHKLARRGKINASPEVARFELNWELEITQLERELRAGTWTPGPYRQFEIYEAKPRLISAAPYRDRVVHQAIVQVIEPLLEPTLIHDTYACRKGKGSHAAVDRAQRYLRGRRFVMHLDVVKYYPTLPQGRLKLLLRRFITDPLLLDALEKIIDHDGAPCRSGNAPRHRRRSVR